MLCISFAQPYVKLKSIIALAETIHQINKVAKNTLIHRVRFPL